MQNRPPHWQPAFPLAQLSTWKIGGPARYASAPASREQLRDDLRAARRERLPVLAIGGGSNLLFADAGYDGLVVRIPREEPLVLDGRLASARMSALHCIAAGDWLAPTVRRLAGAGWAGLHWADGIPGTVGGAIVNNAGAYGGQIADRLASVHVMLPDGSEEEWPAARLALAYRSSALKGNDPTGVFLLAGTFRLERQDAQLLLEGVREIGEQRAAKLPRLPSCGCVFRNPPGQVAGRLIEKAGLRGHSIGDAQISPQHANFIVNRGQARAADVLELIGLIRERVRAHCRLTLDLEVQLAGFEPVAAPLGSAVASTAGPSGTPLSPVTRSRPVPRPRKPGSPADR